MTTDEVEKKLKSIKNFEKATQRLDLDLKISDCMMYDVRYSPLSLQGELERD